MTQALKKEINVGRQTEELGKFADTGGNKYLFCVRQNKKATVGQSKGQIREPRRLAQKTEQMQ